MGFLPLKTSEHMAAFGMFGLCQIYMFVTYVQSKVSKARKSNSIFRKQEEGGG